MGGGSTGDFDAPSPLCIIGGDMLSNEVINSSKMSYFIPLIAEKRAPLIVLLVSGIFKHFAFVITLVYMVQVSSSVSNLLNEKALLIEILSE